MSRRPLLSFAAGAAAALAALAWLYARDAPLRVGFGVDAYHHMAAVRELARGEVPPRHDLVVEPGLPQGHYGPYLVVCGFVARLTGASPLAVLYVAGCCGLLAYLALFRAVARRCGASDVGALAALIPVLLWGPWPARVVVWTAWHWPGTTSLADPQNFFYPHHAGLVLLLGVLLLVLPPDADAPLAAPTWPLASAAIVLMAALVATHALTAIGLAIALLALGACDAARGAPVRRLLVLGALPVAGLALAALWPYYPVLKLLAVSTLPGFREPIAAAAGTGGAPAIVATETAPAVGMSLVPLLGPSIVGLAGCVLLAWRRRPWLLAWFAAEEIASLCPLVPLRHRFVFFAAIPVQIAAAVLLSRAWARGPAWRAAVVLLLAAGTASVGLRTSWVLRQEKADLAFVTEATPDSAVVLTDQDTANGVAGLAGRKVVAPQHPDLFLVAAGGWQRVLDVRRFMGQGATTAERDAIARRWGATHVLIDRLADPQAPALPYPVLREERGYVLYAVPPARP